MWSYCVTASNVTLGVFPTMADAVESVRVSCEIFFEVETPVQSHECYREYETDHGWITIVACYRSEAPQKLFRDSPAQV